MYADASVCDSRESKSQCTCSRIHTKPINGDARQRRNFPYILTTFSCFRDASLRNIFVWAISIYSHCSEICVETAHCSVALLYVLIIRDFLISLDKLSDKRNDSTQNKKLCHFTFPNCLFISLAPFLSSVVSERKLRSISQTSITHGKIVPCQSVWYAITAIPLFVKFSHIQFNDMRTPSK